MGVLVGKMMCARGKGCVFCVRTQGCVQGWTLLCLYTHTHAHTHTLSLSLSLSLCPWSSRIFGGEKAVCLSMCALGELVSRTEVARLWCVRRAQEAR